MYTLPLTYTYIHTHIHTHVYLHIFPLLILCFPTVSFRSMQFVADYYITGYRRCIGCLIFIGIFPQKTPKISSSFAERDLQLVRHSVHLRHPVLSLPLLHSLFLGNPWLPSHVPHSIHAQNVLSTYVYVLCTHIRHCNPWLPSHVPHVNESSETRKHDSSCHSLSRCCNQVLMSRVAHVNEPSQYSKPNE